MAFTSNIIRKIWHERQGDDAFFKAHPEIPGYLYSVKNVLGTLADVQDEGYRSIVVQPTHLTAGEEFMDVQAYVEGCAPSVPSKTNGSPLILSPWGAL